MAVSNISPLVPPAGRLLPTRMCCSTMLLVLVMALPKWQAPPPVVNWGGLCGSHTSHCCHSKILGSSPPMPISLDCGQSSSQFESHCCHSSWIHSLLSSQQHWLSDSDLFTPDWLSSAGILILHGSTVIKIRILNTPNYLVMLDIIWTLIILHWYIHLCIV